MILSPIYKDIDAVVSQPFDFVITGGGTGGLTLATLLSDDPAVSVLVIDKGLYRPDDLKVLAPLLWDTQIGDPAYDHTYMSVPQQSIGGNPVLFSAGKTLGGTSALNAMTFIQVPRNELEAWTELGNKTWDWPTFHKYSKEVETYHRATPEQAKLYQATADAAQRGSNGRIHLSQTSFYSTLLPLWFKALNNIGIKTNVDPRVTGTNAGAWAVQNMINPTTNERSYAANAYYAPSSGRKNLVVVTEAQVTKACLSETADPTGCFTATGVEFLYEGRSLQARARREVVLSAGNITSPKLLELSGIGSKSILQAAGIQSKIDLPGVGENFQEHFAFNQGFPLEDGFTTLDQLRDPTVFAEQKEQFVKSRIGLFGAGQSALAYVTATNLFDDDTIRTLQSQVDDEIRTAQPGLREQYTILRRWLGDDNVPFVEIFPLFKFFFLPGEIPPPQRTYISFGTFLTHPFSRGTVHVQSSDPCATPAIDPRPYSHPIDRKIALAAIKFTRDRIVCAPPLAAAVGPPVFPLAGATDDELWASITQAVVTGHGIGTCSMLPRAMGGVVDETLKVYGTTNLRVVDTSVFPFHMSTHTAAPTYAAAHKTAAYIKEHVLGKAASATNP